MEKPFHPEHFQDMSEKKQQELKDSHKSLAQEWLALVDEEKALLSTSEPDSEALKLLHKKQVQVVTQLSNLEEQLEQLRLL